MKKIQLFDVVFLFAGSIVLLFIIVPILSLILASELRVFIHAVTDIEVLRSLWLSLWSAMVATMLFALISTPLAYLLARHQFYGKSFIIGIIHLPLLIPHTAAGIALLTVLSEHTLPGRLLSAAGLQIVGSPIAIILAMAFVSVPFYIISAVNAFASVPEKYEQAAWNLGASRWKIFFTISLPLAKKGILYGFMTMWARGMSEFGAVVMLAYFPMVAPVLIYHRFTSYGIQYALPPTIVVIVISIIFLMLIQSMSEKK